MAQVTPDRPVVPPRGRRLACAVGILLVLLTWVALGGVLGNGFVNYDDDLYLTQNPFLALGPGLAGLEWAFTTTRGGNWHPLTWYAHLVDVRLFGMNPAAHHAVSLALHGACVLLLFSLLRALTGALWPSALAAALFAVHPLHVESVAWAAERKDVLATALALGAALAYVRGVRRPAGRGARIAAPALFALALAAKPMPLSLPLLLLLLDWWPLGRWSPRAGRAPGPGAPPSPAPPPVRLLLEKTPFVLLAVGSGLVTWAVQSGAGAMRAVAGVPPAARAANALVAYARYLGKTVWPDGLAVLYPYPAHGHGPLAVAGAAAVLGLLGALALRESRRRPWLAAGLLWYVVSLLPVIGVVQVGVQAMADRYTYLPLVGVFVAATWGAAELAGRGRRSATAVAAVSLACVVALGFVASRQVATWRDGVTLFSRAVAVTEGNFVAHNNLGNALLERGDAAQALPHFGESARLAPASPLGYLNLGRALVSLGRHQEAVGWFREAVSRDPSNPLPHLHLAQALDRSGRLEEAIASYRAALRLGPGDPRTLDQAGVALARAGRVGEAIPLLEEAAARDPGNPAPREHLAVARAQAAKGPSVGRSVPSVP